MIIWLEYGNFDIILSHPKQYILDILFGIEL